MTLDPESECPLDGPDDIAHIRQMQSRQGHAIGGMKSCLKASRRETAEIKDRVYRVETLAYAFVVFLATFCVAFALGISIRAEF